MAWTMRERKVPGGKLLRVKAECDGGIVSNVLIEGDFFLFPEEGIVKLEQALIGVSPTDKEESMRRLERTLLENRLQIVGFSLRDIAELLEEIRCSRTDGA